jgi:hypothetical protein
MSQAKLSELSFIIINIILSGVRLGPLDTAATIDLLYQTIDYGDWGAIGE